MPGHHSVLHCWFKGVQELHGVNGLSFDILTVLECELDLCELLQPLPLAEVGHLFVRSLRVLELPAFLAQMKIARHVH